MSYASVNPSINSGFSNGVTAVDCEKQVRSWRLLRCLIQLLIPSCHCTNPKYNHEDEDYDHNASSTSVTSNRSHAIYDQKKPLLDSTTVVTGTILRYGRGKLNFCLQKTPNSTDPILLIEMVVPANVLAEEMRGGVLRIALESVATNPNDSNIDDSLLNSTVWAMYCNGRRVGYAVKRRPTEDDVATLRMMKSTVVGTGKVCREGRNNHLGDVSDEVMFLRANFKRVTGSSNSESFHLIDPEECVGQELSIFFFRLK